MEFFRKAKSVRLRSYHDKYLIADADESSVYQDRNGTTKKAIWTVEIVDGCDTLVRLRSCYGKFLTASDDEFLFGLTGRKVTQTEPRKIGSAVEWQPIEYGSRVRLKSQCAYFLRANGGLPPLRNSVTHDIPLTHSNWVLWEVDVVEALPESEPQPKTEPESKPVSVAPEPKPDPKPPPMPQPQPGREAGPSPEPGSESEPSSPEADSSDYQLLSSPSINLRTPRLSKVESMKSEGRVIHYSVMDEHGKVEEGSGVPSFNFKGHGLEELKKTMEEKTGVKDAILCSRNPLNGKLYPLRLHLPPNNATMNIVVVPPSCHVAGEFQPDTPKT